MTHHHTHKAAAARRVGRLVPLVAGLLLLIALAVLSFYFVARAWEDGEPGVAGQPPLAESPHTQSEPSTTNASPA